jgi:flagellar hook assembly protein FlgD
LRPLIRRSRAHLLRFGILMAGVALLSLGCQADSPVGPAGAQPTGGESGASTNPSPSRITPVIIFPPSQSQTLTVRIYDSQGRLVRAITVDLGVGPHVIEWDGRADSGLPVGSGVYTYQGETSDGERLVATVTLVR